jgi:hypothetical protein
MSSFREETILEALVESLTTLPHEVRRNLDLLQSQDRVLGYVMFSHGSMDLESKAISFSH